MTQKYWIGITVALSVLLVAVSAALALVIFFLPQNSPDTGTPESVSAPTRETAIRSEEPPNTAPGQESFPTASNQSLAAKPASPTTLRLQQPETEGLAQAAPESKAEAEPSQAAVVSPLPTPTVAPAQEQSGNKEVTPESSQQQRGEGDDGPSEPQIIEPDAASPEVAVGASPDQDFQTIEQLITATESPEWKARWDAVNELGLRQDPRGLPALVQRALFDDNSHPRWRSLWALSAIEREGTQAIPLFVANLEHPDPVVVRNAAVALAFFGQPEARAELLRALKDSDTFRRWEAVFSLGEIGAPEVVEALLPLSEDRVELETRVRQEVVLVLGRIGGEEVVPALLNALQEDRSPGVRWRAALALSRLGDASLRGALEQALAAEDDPMAQEYIEDALANLGGP